MIDKLREENSKLSQDVYELRNKADAESKKRLLIEEENRQLRSKQQWLEGQVRDRIEAANYFKNSAVRCLSRLDKVLPILEELRMDTSLDLDGTMKKRETLLNDG